MGKSWTHKECFDYFGVVPKNPRWSWSGRSPAGAEPKIAVTFWQDKFEEQGKRYSSLSHSADEKWFGSPGHNGLLPVS